MSCKYFHCTKCENLFIGGPDEKIPERVACMAGLCRIEEVTLDEATRLAEEKRDERDD